MSSSLNMSESAPLLSRQQRINHRVKAWSRLCIKSKSAFLIILLTIFVGAIFTIFFIVTLLTVVDYYKIKHINAMSTYPFSFFYVILALVAILYPLIGYMADVSYGRFKVVMFSSCLLIVSFITFNVLGVTLALIMYLANDINVDVIQTLAVGLTVTAALIAFIGIAGYQSNFIQLGLDQLLSAPSEDLALFVHWAMWAYNTGCTIVTIGYSPSACLISLGIAGKFALICTLNIFIFFCTLMLLLVSCFKRRWFNTETSHGNPCKLITKVLSFARKHKYPLQRSAFTYSNDRKPSRLDFAKERFGGPFTTEQVEDTKTFFKILAVLLSLSPVFIMDIPSSLLGFMSFGYHIGNVHSNTAFYVLKNGTYFDHCGAWIAVWSGNLKYVSGTLIFPLYIWFVFSYLRSRIPKMFTRIAIGVVIYLCGVLCMMITDLVGHIQSAKQDTPGSDSGNRCMFSFGMRTYPHLKMHWAVMIPPSVLLGVGPLIVMTTTLEFISAQSPHLMKGLFVGILFAIGGLFQLIGALVILPFSSRKIWATQSMIEHPPPTSCGFDYLLLTFLVAFIGFIFFLVVAKKYTYRVRDDDPYDQSQVEEIVSRYLERTVDYCIESDEGS